MLLSDVCLTSLCLSVAYIGPNSRTKRPRKTKVGTETRTPLSRSKGQRSRSPGRFGWLYWQANMNICNGDLSICVHDVYRVTTCRPGRGISWRPPALQFVVSEVHIIMARSAHDYAILR